MLFICLCFTNRPSLVSFFSGEDHNVTLIVNHQEALVDISPEGRRDFVCYTDRHKNS